MNHIFKMIEEQQMTLWLLLAVMVLAVIFWNLYRREKKKTKVALEQIAKERQFYEAYVDEGMSLYLYVRKSDLRVVYVSPNFEKMTGISKRRIYADIQVLSNLVSSQLNRNIQKQLAEWDKEQVFQMEVRYHVIGQDQKRYAKVTINPMDGQAYYLVSIYDITEDHKIRSKMKAELNAAKRESQEKTDFLSKMSHEIRTPMNGILGMLNLAKAHSENPVQTREYLTKTEELSQFLLTLINDILDMSRIESGKMQLEQKPFDLFEMAEKLDTMFRENAEAKGIRWSVKMFDFDVRYVIGDEMRLNQVIINFISNAIKFTNAGGSVSVVFRQMSKLDGNLHLMIRVKDTGKGIKEDFISKIFQPFEQEDASTAQNYGGSGLGMAIADNIIKLMNGEILVESEEGKGTEFAVYVALPIADSMAEETAFIGQKSKQVENDKNRKQAIDEFTLDGIRILLAEDNDINAEIAIEILEMQGASVTRARDGVEAVQIFAESNYGAFDVILMDIQMPRMDGWEATGEIRKMNRADSDIVIFAMSANAFLEDQRHSLDVGMNDHINKPVDFDELRRKIGAHLLDSRIR